MRAETPELFLHRPFREAGLPVPEAIMPEQFFATTKPDTPEVRLMIGVLGDAVHIIRTRASRRQRVAVEARQWLLSDDTDWPFSFVNVCQALGLPVDRTRRTVLEGGATRARTRLGPRRPRVEAASKWIIACTEPAACAGFALP